MNWGDKPYNNFNFHMREKFGDKIIKLSLNGGFYCPNRDGNKGYGGCIFCSELGSGDFAGNPDNKISLQIEEQKEKLKNKWPSGKFIAYFQNFSNTYGDLNYMKKIYNQALIDDDIAGIAIATRPDCLGKEVVQLLSEINREKYLWVELGIQSTKTESLEFLNTRYNVEEFYGAVERLKEAKIETVAHQILGIPGESREDIIKSSLDISRSRVSGMKLHMMNVLKNTRLADIYNEEKFYLMTMEEYIELLADILEIIPKDIVIHRLTGDGPKDILIEPRWILDKRAVLNGIFKEMRRRNSYQGKLSY